MPKYLFIFVFFYFQYQYGNAQRPLPVLKANNPVLSILDGEDLKENYWTVSPSIALDKYTADKTQATKRVTFYSDIDSLSFVVEPLGTYDFIVLLNGKDSCFQRLESGITFQADENTPPTSDTIPFTFTKYNNISIQAILNGMDTLDLMFHTAAIGVGVIRKVSEKLKSFEIDETIEGASGWGGDGTMRVSNGNTLEIGAQNWEDLAIFEGEHSGHFTDGKFGPDRFKDKVVEIDFHAQRLIVHSHLPAIGDGFEKYDLLFKGPLMFLQGKFDIGDGRQLSNNLLIHSGYSGAVLLDDQFVSDHRIGEKLEIIKEQELKDSFGNVVKTRKAILPSLTLGGITFRDMPIGFFEGAMGRQRMSVLGGDLLKRFHLILDLQSAEIYLKPNELVGLAFSDH